MRTLLLSLTFLLAGCAVPPSAVTAPQEVENARGQFGAAAEAQAASQAAGVSSVARLYVATNEGSSAGLAAELRSTEPALVSAAHVLTDDLVAFQLAEGECLYQPLPSGTSYTAPC